MTDPIRVASTATIRWLDQACVERAGMPSIVLMENAGRGIADLIRTQFAPRRILVACGPGNNGGDGFVIARHLDEPGRDVTVAVTCSLDRLRGDALATYHWLATTDVHLVRDLSALADLVDDQRYDVIVDAILGTGSQGPLRSPLDQWLRRLNELHATKIAVDLPSGLDSETGEAAEDTFRADVTCTFIAAKPGLVTEQARPFVGTLCCMPLGMPRQLLQEAGLDT